MIERIKIENFQMIRKLDLDFKESTAIVGVSKQGKSCILRAVEAMVNNTRGKKFIKKGETYCRVIVQTNRGKVEWIKKADGGSQYHVATPDGKVETFERVEECPRMVREIIGVAPVKFGEDIELTVNMAGQFDQPFLIFETGSTVAKVLGKFTRLDEIYGAIRTASKDLSSLKSDDKVRRAELGLAKEKLERHQGIEHLEPLIDALEKQGKGLDEKKARLEALRKGQAEAWTIRRKLVILSGLNTCKATLNGWPVPALPGKVSQLKELRALLEEVRALRRKIEAAKVAEVAEDLDGWPPAKITERLKDAEFLVERIGTARTNKKHADYYVGRVKAQKELLTKKAAEFDKFKADNPGCPLCGRAWV